MERAYKTKLRRNDQVVVIAGKDKGKTGRILRIDLKNGRAVVEGVNMVKKAQRRRSRQDRGGIIELEAPISLSNLMAMTKDGRPSRVAVRTEGGEKVRVLKKSGEQI
ncbi:MAG: 50S ribosomal protein L24 [Spirochaetaceae bacterium]